MKITLEINNEKFTYESTHEAFDASELKEIFSRMLVQATYPPDTIVLADGGHFECKYVEEK